MCNLECDHCFVYSGPSAKGSFTLSRIRDILDEAAKLGTIKWIYFEGGEPFLFYPVMLEGIKLARRMGFKVGVVTNAYYATSTEDTELWFKPLSELGVSSLSISDDVLHYEDEKDSPSKRALAAAKRLSIPSDSICIEKPSIQESKNRKQGKGKPVTEGNVMLRGRAVEKLVEESFPQKQWEELRECPHEELRDPERVHIDPYGNVHLCQGLSMGNVWEIPLSKMVDNYNAELHPICAPLIKGGPALLAKKYNVKHEDTYIDECHFCFLLRLALIDRFPQYLTPRQVYGLE
jgi:MoaA/NifB/PqqE/SkfB family radical SAM enzyme